MLRPTRLIIIILICFAFLIALGCVTQSPPKNVTTSLPSFYTAPIGGFETPWAGVIEPNNVLQTNYIFYSRNWGPGKVKYTLTGSYNDTQFVSDPHLFYIEPSSFTAEPGHIYKSHVFLNTSHIPDYIAPNLSCRSANCPGCNSIGCRMYAAHLKVNVSLDDNSSHFGDDNMFFYPGISSGSPRYLNTLSIDNCSIAVKRGETRTFNASFMEGGGGGIGKVSFLPSTTPLNVTITPSEYIEKHFIEFPSVVSITADPSLVQGYYPIDITINGAISSTIVRCKDRGPGDIYIGPGYLTPIPTINVTVV